MVGIVFDIGQQIALAGAFRLAGYDGPLVTAPVTSEEERAFLVEPEVLRNLWDVEPLVQVLQQLFGRKVIVVERSDSRGIPVPFV
jgi:hypothetical protein